MNVKGRGAVAAVCRQVTWSFNELIRAGRMEPRLAVEALLYSVLGLCTVSTVGAHSIGRSAVTKTPCCCFTPVICWHFDRKGVACRGGRFFTWIGLADLHAGGCRELCATGGWLCGNSVAAVDLLAVSDVAVGAHRGGGRWRWPNTKKFISRVKRSFAWTVSRLRWWTFAAALVNAGSDPGGRGAGRGSGAGQHCQARCCAERASARVLGKGLFNAVAQARHCCCCCSAVVVPGQHMSNWGWQGMPTCPGLSTWLV